MRKYELHKHSNGDIHLIARKKQRLWPVFFKLLAILILFALAYFLNGSMPDGVWFVWLVLIFLAIAPVFRKVVQPAAPTVKVIKEGRTLWIGNDQVHYQQDDCIYARLHKAEDRKKVAVTIGRDDQETELLSTGNLKEGDMLAKKLGKWLEREVKFETQRKDKENKTRKPLVKA